MSSPPINLRQLADDYLAAWASHDPQAIAALHSADSTFEVHGRGVRAVGQAELLVAFGQVLARYPEFGAEVHRLLLGDRHWVLDWTLTFRIGGTERGFRCVDIVEVSTDGLVTRKDTFYDHPQAQIAMTGAA